LPAKSAGILLFRKLAGEMQIFLVHPGGPFWAKRDEGAWSVPKGLVSPSEDPLSAARREFFEETGFSIDPPFHELGTFKQPSGKHIMVWAHEGDCDPTRLTSNVFSLVWPPKSGKTKNFPEVDKGGWFRYRDAVTKIVKGQRPVVEAAFRRFA
jgi:predicted NUDIX family NTP pyrophosphohydrolase